MMHIELLREWISGLPTDAEIGVDEGGLCLVTNDVQNWLEIGGIPEVEE